jgi:hypothetical protein
MTWNPRSSVGLVSAAAHSTPYTNPTRKRGNDLEPSLERRVSVGSGRESYIMGRRTRAQGVLSPLTRLDLIHEPRPCPAIAL